MKTKILEITSIEDMGICNQYVYDIGMKDTPHTFFANNILVHNSVFVSALPLIEKRHDICLFSDKDFIEKTIEIANEIQTHINESYNEYAKRYHNLDKHRFFIKQELV